MNKWKYALTLAIAQILQATVLSRLPVYSAQINLVLTVVVVISILYGEKWGAYTGLGLGLLGDIIFADVLGIRALSYFLIGTFVGTVMKNTSRNRAAGALVTFAGTFFHRFFCWGVALLLRRPISVTWYFIVPLLLEAVLNAILFLAVLFCIKQFLKPQTVHKYSGY